MGGKEEVTSVGYEAVYTGETKVLIEGKYFLPIELSGKTFALPLVNVTPDNETSMAIAWFDPKPEKNPLLADASADAMAGLLRKLKADVVVMPKSSKSEAFITKAVDQLDGVILIKLLGGSRERMNEEDLKFESEAGRIVSYVPVTGVAKVMGLPVKEATVLRHAHHNGLQVVLADDVLSTGKTSEAMGKTLAPIFGDTYEHILAVIAREALLNPSYPPPLPPRTNALLAIPEIAGLDKTKLFSIKNREAIPQAVLL